MNLEVLLCNRCHKKPRALDKKRCEGCLAYAREWQKRETAIRRDAKVCITCGATVQIVDKVFYDALGLRTTRKEPLSRCARCSHNKSESHKGTKPIAQESLALAS